MVSPDMMQRYRQAIILGSTRGIRRLDATRSIPSSLHTVKPSGTVLDWALHALSRQEVDQVTYVGGYQIQKVFERYPALSCRYHASWQRDGELAALLTFEPNWHNGCLVLRSSTLFLPEALVRLANASGDVVVGYHKPETGDEDLGMVVVRNSRLEAAYVIAKKVVEISRSSDLNKWIDALVADGFHISRVDLDGLAAPISDQLALARTLFSGKAQTLARIRPLVKHAIILDQLAFNVEDWDNDPKRILETAHNFFGYRQVLVRSSAFGEESLAGRFRTVLDVPAHDETQLREAIGRVIGSYSSNGRAVLPGDEVFVQQQVSDLAASGVLLTRDPETGTPYFVLNIDRWSGRSDTVTSGSQAPFDTVYVSRRAAVTELPSDVGTCVTIARELQELMSLDALDIEFGIGRSGEAYVFQVRPIPRRARKLVLADEDLEEELQSVHEFLKAHMRPHPHLHGSTALFSTMTDWNPAEMIGTTPRPLALSLYQRLIGLQAWAEARANIGYRDVRPEPLIVALGGRPYVDVRASLNSFLPEGLDSGTASKWVEHGLQLLRQAPRLHDKVEFEVALPCLTLDDEEPAARLSEAGLTNDEIASFRGQLLALTDRILLGEVAPFDQQFDLIRRLEPRRVRTMAAEETNVTSQARQIHHLLQDCERFGVVPFSVLARYAFIAMALLRSLRTMGIFTNEEYEAILRSIPTVATELSQDLARHASCELTTDDFLNRYGHLRPSSYDITSPNYAAGLELYLKGDGQTTSASGSMSQGMARNLFDARADVIDGLLHDQGFVARSVQVRDFVLRAIPGREWAKFEFMKNVDAALETIAKLGEQLSLDRHDMSFLPLEQIVRGATDSPNVATHTRLRREIEFTKKRWNLTCAVHLPNLVRDPQDVDVFELEEWTPNFVSSQSVIAPPMVLDGPVPNAGLDGRIVLIRAADPGYDWIFGHKIAGMVTQYGGVASHMAIRAAEFGLPAAIGCGERKFERLRGARLVELDCMNQRVNAIQ